MTGRTRRRSRRRSPLRMPSPRRLPTVVAAFRQAQGDKVLAGFWLRIEKVGKCWVWQGAVNWAGYGIYRRQLVHRFAHRVLKGPIEGLVVRHTCDNPICVRPDHLLAGTQKENMADKVARGRARGGKPQVGEFNSNTKISPRLAQAALDLWAQGYRQADIARVTSIPPRSVSNIVRRKNWTHLEPGDHGSQGVVKVPGERRHRALGGKDQ